MKKKVLERNGRLIFMRILLLQVLTTDYSARAASAVMNRLAKLSARFIGEHGFSIGIDDVTPAHELQVCSSYLSAITHASPKKTPVVLLRQRFCTAHFSWEP